MLHIENQSINQSECDTAKKKVVLIKPKPHIILATGVNYLIMIYNCRFNLEEKINKHFFL